MSCVLLEPRKTKNISLGYYPARDYEACVEFGEARKKKPVVLTTYYLPTLAEHLLKLYGSICVTESYIYKETSFRLQPLGKNSVCKLTYDKKYFNFKLNELNYLLAIITVIENQLPRYSIAKNDVIFYATNVLGSDKYVQIRHEASTFVLYDVLYDELKTIM